MRLVTWLIAVPILALAGAFAAANHGTVTLSLWPLPFEVSLPLYAAVLGAFFAGFLIAALYFWVATMPLRLERRRLARHERALEDETRRLRARLAESQHGPAPTTPEAVREAQRRLVASGD